MNNKLKRLHKDLCMYESIEELENDFKGFMVIMNNYI